MADVCSRWAVTLFALAISGYRIVLRSVFPTACRFYPSCSSYAEESIRRFGPITGAWMTACRLLRCHPFSPGGYDPLPERE